MTNFEKYFKALQAHRIDEITEHSLRGHLQCLLESLSGASIRILHEPKRESKFGAPDFKITCAESITGYVENKKIEENLDKVLKSEQIKKYRTLSDNILLTNYIEWIWIREGDIQQREMLCYLTDVEDKRKKLDNTKIAAVEKLIKSFFSQAPKKIADTKKLAEVLAVRARLLKDFLHDELKRQEKEHREGRLYQLFEVFQTYVFNELTVEEFADAFSQNLVYGLFLAKLNADTQTIHLYNAKKFIPASFELIRELVNFLDELDNEEYRETKWVVEEVLTIMNHLDLRAIHESLSFTKKKKDKDADNITIKDPYVYFYEDFLASYDKNLRKSKGVYYTPPPVVNFIVRSIDEILKSSFNIKDGLADRNKITVLDFATGTGTFLVEIFQQIFDNLPKDSGKKDLLISEHILKNIFGFEYLIAPYTIAHLKLSQFLKDNDYELKAKERLQVYLTNTLEPIELQQRIPFLPALTEESKQSQRIKNQPILVITGNPPYSNYSTNKGNWIDNLLHDYKKELNEKKINLDDDYIKFIRFAQNKMDKVEEGIIGIITNNSFLGGITHRQMRKSLLHSFDRIYVLNLHGYYLETATDGSKDENVFDIKQGVAISIFVKNKNIKEKGVFYSELFGKRNDKYKQLLQSDRKTVEWKKLELDDKYFFFKPFDYKGLKIYEQSFAINEIFEKYGTGVKTERDHITIHFDENSLIQTLSDFESLSEKEIREKYKTRDSRDWTVKNAKNEIIELKNNWASFIKPISYRPFDLRYTLYTGKGKAFIGTPGYKINSQLLEPNKALTVKRQNKFEPFSYAFVLDKITESCFFESSFANNSIFPLYLYSDAEKTVNFTRKFSDFVQNQYSAEDIFNYIYAVLYSPAYRSKYAELLKIDFPRIPFTPDKQLFEKLSKLGKELVNEHLREENIDKTIGFFLGKGSEIVENVTYIQGKKSGKIYINKTQYFDDVPLDVWEFQIGGYQVVDKFLKERKNRKLDTDIDKVEEIINLINFTIKQIKKIDNLTKHWI